MRRFEPSPLIFYSYWFGSHKRSVNESGEYVLDKNLPGSFREFPQIADSLLKEFAELDLVAASASLRKLFDLSQESDSTIGQMQELSKEIQGRLMDELKARYFLSLSVAEADRFENWQKSWESILERFPDTVRDVEEMNKCFALARYTAAMFHALQVAEWGAINLGDFIGVVDPKKGWGPTEKKLRELVHSGHTNLPAGLAGKFDFLEQMHREINSMVLAWRNKVDHAANHLAIVPNSDFTPDIAEHIIGAVKIFMQRLKEGVP